MKKILSNIYLLAALFMIGAAITSCSKSDDTPGPEPKPVGPTTYTMTIKATKGGDAKTRALTPDGSAINATWTEGDVVVVYEGETELGTLTAQDLTDGNTKCTLKGTNIQAPTGSSVTLKYQGNPNYSSQGGTIAYISANCDYAKADVEVTVDKDKKRITGSGADFVNQQAIVKFTLKEGEALLSPGALKVQFSTTTEPANIVTVTLSDISSIYSTNGDGVVYVAIPGATYNVTLNATMENTFYTDTYSYTKSGATFVDNKYYAITVKMVKKYNPYTAPLTFEAANGDVEVSFYQVNNNSKPLYYSTDSINWTSHNRSTAFYVSLSKGNKVYIKGDDITNGDSEGPTRISCSGACYVYGNMMSLIYYDFIAKNEITQTNVFLNLFKDDIDNNSEYTRSIFILSHPTKKLALPATTLAPYCYQSMFWGCSNLERAPELPAPEVPTMAYQAMFNGCSSLNYVKCLATSFGTDSTFDWLQNVAATGNFIAAKTATWSGVSPTWSRDKDGIPSGWTPVNVE